VSSSSSSILRRVEAEKAFYFYYSQGKYSGEKALTLEEFANIIRRISSESLEFHLYRGDFEKWINEVVGDKELGDKLSQLRSMNIKGDALRGRLGHVVSKRLGKLKRRFSEGAVPSP
jgi:hypothetical protein